MRNITSEDREKILELHKNYDVNHIVFLMDYKYHASDINQVLREHINAIESKVSKLNNLDKIRIEQIKERLYTVIGKPWIYELEYEMCSGTTNALNIYYSVIDLGRDGKEWEFHQNNYRLTHESVKRTSRIRALGRFFENCREDIQYLLSLHSES